MKSVRAGYEQLLFWILGLMFAAACVWSLWARSMYTKPSTASIPNFG